MVSKGLKYTPTPKLNAEELKDDITKFTGKIKLRKLFNSETEDMTVTDSSLVRNKGHFNPPRNRDIVLDTFTDLITKFPI